MGCSDARHAGWAVVLRARIDVLGVEAGLILALGGYLDLEPCLLGRLEVVGEVCGLVQALEGAGGVGLLEVLVMARSALGLGLGLSLRMRMSLSWVGN